MNDAPPTPPRTGEGDGYTDVRERLVSMGYLTRPLERYVLGGVARPGSFLRRHAAVSLRVALAAGPLLGLLFALAVVVANRPRFSHASDFLVLAGGFTLVFGAAVFLLELAAGTLLAVFVRWRGRGVAAFPATAARAGFAVSLVLSAYLAFWWRRRAGDAGIAIDLAGLAVLVLVNAALLRVSSLASLAALVRVSDLPKTEVSPIEPRADQSRRRTAAIVAAILLTVGFFIAPRSRHDAPSSYTPRPMEGRLIVIAWDGVPGMVADWRAHGLDAVDQQSAFAPRPLIQIPVTKPSSGLFASPASLWTAVATGRLDNGVGALEEKHPMGLSSPVGGNVPLGDLLPSLLPGRKVAVSAGVRIARTLWEILHDHEGVGSIGWWATWPAVDRATEGIPFDVVTDRALFALRRPSEGDLLIAPPSLERRVNGEFDSDLAELRSRGSGSDGTPEINHFSRAAGEENRADLEQAAVIDGYAATLTFKLLGDFRVRNLFVYLPGVDIARVAVARRTPERADRFVWWYADYAWAQIRRVEGALKPEDTLVLIATPGRRDPLAAREALIESWPKPLSWSEEDMSKLKDAERDFETRLANARASSPWGWVLIWGPLSARVETAPHVAASAGMEMSLLDIAPTLLNLRGFPVSREMDGRSLVQYPDESQRPAPIDTYGRNTLPAIPFSSSSEEVERETLERLRSLGYLN